MPASVLESVDVAADVQAVGRIASVRTILEAICQITGLGFSAVARVTEERWIACAVRDEIAFGLQPGGELPIATTLCNEVRAQNVPIVINDLANDACYREHPTPSRYGFQSYISVPIVRADGGFWGTLCAIDPRPAHLDKPATLATFQLFAQLIAAHLEAQDREALLSRALSEAKWAGQLRDEFIAVLGHDLRSPLDAIATAAAVIRKDPGNDDARHMTHVIERSTVRMGELIENVLDLAQGRLGGGLTVRPIEHRDLALGLNEIVQRFQATSPDCSFTRDIELSGAIRCDKPRIEQLLSNLLANAITHGKRGGQVRVTVLQENGELVLAVCNEGPAIPPSRRPHLFQPFYRGSKPSEQGLGLGLYLCDEIARAHGGSIEVESTDQQTCFTFRMPASG